MFVKVSFVLYHSAFQSPVESLFDVVFFHKESIRPVTKHPVEGSFIVSCHQTTREPIIPLRWQRHPSSLAGMPETNQRSIGFEPSPDLCVLWRGFEKRGTRSDVNETARAAFPWFNDTLGISVLRILRFNSNLSAVPSLFRSELHFEVLSTYGERRISDLICLVFEQATRRKCQSFYWGYNAF